MGRIFITGSTDGLGLAAARTLMEKGHLVVLHAHSPQHTSALADLTSGSLGVVVGDLSSAAETRSVADQVNAIGRMDAVIYNAGSIPRWTGWRRAMVVRASSRSIRSPPIC